METLTHLRPALQADLFIDQTPRYNSVYFMKSKVTGHFSGPYIFREEVLQEVVVMLFMAKPMLYVCDFQESENSIPFNLRLRLATLDDLSIFEFLETEKTIRANFSYFITDKGGFVGPFKLYPNMNKVELYDFYKQKRVYVHRKEWDEILEPVNMQKHAS